MFRITNIHVKQSTLIYKALNHIQRLKALCIINEKPSDPPESHQERPPTPGGKKPGADPGDSVIQIVILRSWNRFSLWWHQVADGWLRTKLDSLPGKAKKCVGLFFFEVMILFFFFLKGNTTECCHECWWGLERKKHLLSSESIILPHHTDVHLTSCTCCWVFTTYRNETKLDSTLVVEKKKQKKTFIDPTVGKFA